MLCDVLFLWLLATLFIVVPSIWWNAYEIRKNRKAFERQLPSLDQTMARLEVIYAVARRLSGEAS